MNFTKERVPNPHAVVNKYLMRLYAKKVSCMYYAVKYFFERGAVAIKSVLLMIRLRGEID